MGEELHPGLLEYNGTYNDYLHEFHSYYYENYTVPNSLDTFFKLDRDRSIFRYFYHVFAVSIVTLNLLLVISIFVSKKQRHLFWNWLILNMTVAHILYGGIACPFTGESLFKRNAGLGLVPCKLASFFGDILDYMSNVTIGMLGIYQCLNAMSPRMLKGVSRALMTSMMIIMPWVICSMLTAVLRITMSEERFGECYKILDPTAQNLWLTLAYGIPISLVLLCFVTMIFVTCSPAITTTDATANGRKNMALFVTICLALCLFLKPVYYFGYSSPFSQRCGETHGILLCNRLTHSFDLLRISVLIIIPLVYLIPSEARRVYRKIRSKPLCKTVDCSSNKQNLRMVKLNSNTDKTAV